jgi:hypothetical protein
MPLQFEMETNTVNEIKYINSLLHDIWPVFHFIQQGPDSSSNTSSCNSSTPSSPALVMTTHTPHSTTKQQFHFPGKKFSFLLSWNLAVFVKVQIEHGLYYHFVNLLMSLCQYLWEKVVQKIWNRMTEWEICAPVTNALL